jgi:hypothetical protein
MNDAAKQDDGLIEGRPAELPALLVAGGSCSHLCRPPRVTESGPRIATPQYEEATRQLHSAD